MKRVFLVSMFLFLVMSFALCQQWNEPVMLSEELGEIYSHTICNDNSGRVWVFWSTYDTTGTNPESRICMKYLDGAEWSETAVVYEDTVRIFSLQTCISDDDLCYISWIKAFPYDEYFYQRELWIANFEDFGFYNIQQVIDKYENPCNPRMCVTFNNELIIFFAQIEFPYYNSKRYSYIQRSYTNVWSDITPLSDWEVLCSCPINTAIATDGANIACCWNGCGTPLYGHIYDGEWSDRYNFTSDQETGVSDFSMYSDRPNCNIYLMYENFVSSEISETRIKCYNGNYWYNYQTVPYHIIRSRMIIDDYYRPWIVARVPGESKLFYTFYDDSAWSDKMIVSGLDNIANPEIVYNDGTIFCLFINYESGCKLYVVDTQTNLGTKREDEKGLEKYTASISNYPNPFNPETTINFDIAGQGRVLLEIYNIKGQHVKTLIKDVTYNAGTHSISWNGKDSKGFAVGSGIYFCRLKTEEQTIVNKMILAK